MGKRVKIVNPSLEVVLSLKNFFKKNPKIEKRLEEKTNEKKDEFYLTDLTPHSQRVAQRWLNKIIKFKEINI